MKNAVFNWSGGKDSSLTLYHCLQNKSYAIRYLLTSVNEKFQRISMHGVRRELLDKQAESLNIPLIPLLVPESVSMNEYDRLMKEKLQKFKQEGIDYSIFGDIFLEDLKKYREERLAQVHIEGVFPIWKRPSTELVREFLDLGFKAVTVCVNEKHLDKSFVGREMDEQFFKDLPHNVDPCGEYGEYHSFVYDGPIFAKPIRFKRGPIVQRKYEPPPQDSSDQDNYHSSTVNYDTNFWYCDLLLA